MSPNGFSKDFPIDAGIFTTAKVSLVDASTDADARDAILAVTTDTFPDRDIQLGHIAVAADTGNVSLQPAAVGGAAVSFDISASAQSGIGVYTKSADAIKSLNLADPPAIAIKDADGQRFVVMDWGYSIAGSGSVSHPIGVLGSVSFGVDAKRNALFAILHRFGKTDRAHIVLDDAFISWRLPRHVTFANGDVNVKPATWLLAEADGSLALTIAATLGWNVNFAKDATLLGVTQNLSARIDASLKATFGFNVSGKYIVVVARETAEPVVRLQLWKQSSKGFNFGFNLTVGAQASDPQLPTSLDDFIKATLGVHGLQVVNDIRDWTEKADDLGQKIAGLTNQAALDLLTQTTGIDAGKEFDKARQTVLDALTKWDNLPTTLPPMLWKLLPPDANAALTTLQTFLGQLKDPATGADALAKALQKATFGDSVEGQFLEAIADKGLLALLDQFPAVSLTAGKVLDVLNGGVIAKLQAMIDQKLGLDQIRKAVTDNDFATIDGWLQNRLGNFLDKVLNLDDLKDIQKALATLDKKATDYYSAGVQALTKKYTVEFAETYQSTTTDTALIDVAFDLSKAGALALFTDVVASSKLDALLTQQVDGVRLNQAKLTHEIKRQGTVDLNLPMFNFHSSSVNDAMATLTAEDQVGRVLLYQITGKDTETVANRASSQLAVLASLEVNAGQAPQLSSDSHISYEMRQVKAGMRPVDLESRTTAFLHDYLGELFSGGDASMRSFYSDLDNALTVATGSQSNHLGDVALSMQLSLPVSVLGGWFQSRDANRLRADQMQLSRALQFAFQNQLISLYFQEPDQYSLIEPVAALLVWSSLPVSTSIDFDGDTLKFNRDRDTFWNWPDVDLRRAVARDIHTVTRLAGRMAGIQALLREAGQSNANDFDPVKANRFVEQALNADGDVFFSSLLFVLAEMVDGAARSLKNVSDSLATAASSPSKAIQTLAQFAGSLTQTFNDRVQTVYSGVSGRVIGPMLLVEASRALGSLPTKPRAMLALSALKSGHAFDLGTFVDGANPPQAEVALAQTLVSAK